MTIQKNKLSFDAKKKENSNTRSRMRYRDFEMDFQVNFEVISKKSKSSPPNTDFDQDKIQEVFSKLKNDSLRLYDRAGVISLFDRVSDEEFNLYDYLKVNQDKELVRLFKGDHITEIYCNFINTKRLEPKDTKISSEDTEDDHWRIRYSPRRRSD